MTLLFSLLVILLIAAAITFALEKIDDFFYSLSPISSFIENNIFMICAVLCFTLALKFAIKRTKKPNKEKRKETSERFNANVKCAVSHSMREIREWESYNATDTPPPKTTDSKVNEDYIERDGKKFDPKTGERIIKQDGKTYRQDWKGDWKPDTDWKGDPKIETDWLGTPKIETDWLGNPKIETDWKGDPIVQPDKSNDSGSGGGSSGGCFITTACVETRSLTDNCVELNSLRDFRDKYIQYLPNGKQIISEYYAIAPHIVAAINKSPDSKYVYSNLYKRLVLKSLELIRSGKNDAAFNNYFNIVNELKSKYLKNT